MSHGLRLIGIRHLSSQFRLTLVWLFAGLVTIVLTLQMTSASFVDGQYLPVGHDAFYHARRILDAVATGELFQFDRLMHVPEGDWVTWPWAYDWFLAKAVVLVQGMLGTANPAAVLMHLPPLLGLVAVALVVGVCAELRLSVAATLVAATCFALHGFTQYQFGVGALDHHGSEQIASLGALWLGLRWFARPAQVGRAAVLGLWLGAAIGIHAGLFILQVPLLAALLLGWTRGNAVPPAATGWFCAGLLCGTLAMLVPAETFWSTRFVIYYLSLFHLYVAACTCIVVLFLCRRDRTPRNLALLAGLAALLALPLLAVLAFSGDFLSGNLATIRDIDEIQSPFTIAAQPLGLRRINQVYTLLVWVAPLALVASLLMALRDRASHRSFFWLACAFGLGLLLLQLRLGSFGVYYLYLPWLVLASMAVDRWSGAARTIWAVLGCVLVVAYYPTVRYQLFGSHVPAMDQQYSSLRALLPVLRDACASDPGVVLAEPGDGHLIRYFTACAVISNNFRLTPLDVAKVKESLDLIALPLDVVRARAPQVKYVVARLVAPNESPDPVLFRQLLAVGGPSRADVRELVALQVTSADGHEQKFLGAFRISAAVE